MKLDKIFLATTNIGKVNELASLINNVEILTLQSFDIKAPDENGVSFRENSELKAKYYGEQSNIATIADDSGLEIEDLDGAPGIQSARFAEINGGFTNAMKKIDSMLNGKNSRAKFTCSLSLWLPSGLIKSFIGELYGTIRFPSKGTNGFGYDPIFVPDNHDITLAEMTDKQKNSISHRYLAIQKLLASLNNE